MNFDYSIYYKIFHREDKEYFEQMVRAYTWLERYIPKKEAKILDVGCGFGFAIYALKKLGYKNVRGIDIAPEMVKVGKKLGLEIELVEDSIAYLSNFPENFDVILAFDVLEHVPKDKQLDFVRALYNALKRPGTLILTTPNANARFACRYRYSDWTHTISFTEHSITFLLKNAGFEQIKINETGFTWKNPIRLLIRKFVRFWHRIEAISEFGWEGLKIPLSLNLLVIAWKL